MTETRFTPDHVWARLEGSMATVGLTDFAQRQLGDITSVQLPGIGDLWMENQNVVVIESTKTAMDLPMPLEGRIVAVNTALLDNPALINSDPQGAGWVFRMTPDHQAEFADLMDAAAYAALVAAPK